MEQQIWEILFKINSPELQAKLLWVKIPFFLIIVLFITIIIIAITRTPYLRLSTYGSAVEILTYRPFGFPKMRQQWRKIMRRLDTGSESEYKLAIIESDTLLDEMLKKMRLAGETMDERLERITPLMISNVEELKNAHQVRNSIVYDPDYRLNLQEARRTLSVYQKTFESLDLFR